MAGHDVVDGLEFFQLQMELEELEEYYIISMKRTAISFSVLFPFYYVTFSMCFLSFLFLLSVFGIFAVVPVLLFRIISFPCRSLPFLFLSFLPLTFLVPGLPILVFS